MTDSSQRVEKGNTRLRCTQRSHVLVELDLYVSPDALTLPPSLSWVLLLRQLRSPWRAQLSAPLGAAAVAVDT